MRASIVYDCLFPFDVGGGERVYRRLAEEFAARGVAVDYATRRQWDADVPGGAFTPVGIWTGDLYGTDGRRRTAAAVGFAFAAFRYFSRRRRTYGIVVTSALPVLTALAVRAALIGSGTRLIADWLEIWPARKWRAYAGVVSGTIAWAMQSVAAHWIREHTVNSWFTARRLVAVSRRARPVVLGLLDMVADQPAALLPAAEPPTVLVVGRLIADKRVDLLPAVMARVAEALPTVRALVVGDGPERDVVIKAIEAAGQSERITLVGRVSDEALIAARGSAAVVLSLSVREGFGLSVAEASASGVPVVVVRGDDNAAIDLIEDGVNGFTADDDLASIAAAIVRAIVADDELRRSSRSWFDAARERQTMANSVDAILTAPSR